MVKQAESTGMTMNWPAWAETVNATARRLGGKFGRAWIAETAASLGIELSEFKLALVEARRRGLVELAGDDMAYLADPALVAASTIRHLGYDVNQIRVR